MLKAFDCIQASMVSWKPEGILHSEIELALLLENVDGGDCFSIYH